MHLHSEFKKRRSLRTKLLIIFILLSAIPLVIVGITSFSASSEAIKTVSVDSFTQVADQLNKSLNLLLKDSEKFLTIGRSDAVINFIRNSKDPASRYSYAMQVINQFKMYREIFEFDEMIKGIYIIGLNGNNISEKRGVYQLRKDIDNIETVQRILSNRDRIHIIPNYKIDYREEITEDNVISIGQVIKKPVTYEQLGVIIVDLDIQAINNLCKNLAAEPASNYYIVEKINSVIYPSGFKFNQKEIPTELIQTVTTQSRGHFVNGSGSKSEFIVFNTLERTGWKIIAISDYPSLMKNTYVIKNITVLTLLLCISFSVVIYIFLSGSLTKPLLDLQKKMKEAENGNLEIVAEGKNRDEITDLCHSFNIMIKKIKELLQLTLREQEELKKYELKALQAQINPHFLYNSLDAIIWRSEAGNRKEVVRITKNLSNFFRISLSKGKDWITISEEIEHVRSYLTIQKMRYRNIMDYSLDVPDNLLDYTILKILIQPLVENALYHGIKNKRAMGHIKISCRELDPERLIFRIEDDGIGMDKQRLEEINRALVDDELDIKSEGGYGLKNINQRVRLFYGKEYGLNLTSRSGEGTTAEMILPKRR